MKELLGRRGSQRSSVGVVLWVRSPTSSASGEAVEPKIVAKAKIGTYKSAELGLKPVAWPCCPASWAREPLDLGRTSCLLPPYLLGPELGRTLQTWDALSQGILCFWFLQRNGRT